jgi:hypothetical protein
MVPPPEFNDRDLTESDPVLKMTKEEILEADTKKRHEVRTASMVKHYKVKVADFLKKVSAEPIVIKDHYGYGF